MWDSFACPQCHKWLRVRRNYPARILRLVLYVAVLFAVSYLIGFRNQRLERAVAITIVPAAALLEELVLRLLPAQIESAAPGGLIAS
jgi:hypothetical protein